MPERVPSGQVRLTGTAAILATARREGQSYSQCDPQPVLLGWVDTSSEGAAGVRAVEHAFAVATGGAFDFALALDPLAIPDLKVLVKANAAGPSERSRRRLCGRRTMTQQRPQGCVATPSH
jgi:hypothetical protein